MQYVSEGNRRKDYEDNLRKYGQDLRVPYYLLFEPEKKSLLVFHLIEDEYVVVEANTAGRLAIPDLNLEAAILDGWVRFWFRGELLPLPGDLLNSLKGTERLRRNERQERAAAEGRLEAEREARVAAERSLTDERAAKAALEAELAHLRARLFRTDPTSED